MEDINKKNANGGAANCVRRPIRPAPPSSPRGASPQRPIVAPNVVNANAKTEKQSLWEQIQKTKRKP